MPKIKILIVEDQAVVAADISDRLRQLGYEVVSVAATGHEAIAKAREFNPDLVLMDIILRGPLDGTAAAALIQKESDIPVVYLTAHADDATLKRAKITGPFGYVLKPFEEREIHTAIEIALYRQQMEARLKKAERLLAATLRSIADAVIATDADGKVTFMNRAAEELTGSAQAEVLGQELGSFFFVFNQKRRQVMQSRLAQVLQSGKAFQPETADILIGAGGEHLPIEESCAPIRDELGRIVGCILIFRDVSARQKGEAERERLIHDLQEALGNVKTLRGLLPICAWCKKIRDDEGYWQKLEVYLKGRSEAEFTHSICPECQTSQKLQTQA
jgi:PAS domain S-box-containing protein